jgi:acyl CoA:acetate/3-ketoacid CoA transferase beta subunit
VSLIVTDLAVMRPTPQGLVLMEVAPGWTVEEVQELTGAELLVSSDFREYEL